MAIKEDCCMILRGEIFLAKCLTKEEIADGVQPNFVSVGNTENFELTPEVNTITKKDYISKIGGVACTYSEFTDLQLNLTLCCLKDLNIGLALAADCIEIEGSDAIPAMPGTGAETVSIVNFVITQETIDEGFLLECEGAEVTFFNILGVTGEDYEIIGDRMFLTAETGNLLGEPLTVTYTCPGVPAQPAVPATVASKKFNLFSAQQEVYQLQFRGCNVVKGSQGDIHTITLHQVCFEPSSSFNFISDEFATVEITARIIRSEHNYVDPGTNLIPSAYGTWCVEEAI